MEQVGKLIQQAMRENNSCLQRQKKSADAVKLIEKYPEYKKFAERFNSQTQLKLSAINPNFVSCYNYNVPKLSTIANAYDTDAAINWLKIQFENLNDFVGVREKMQLYQLNELATLFFAECYSLNISEVMFFFIKLKRGDFGEFYGSIDPLKIMSAKNEFISQRRLALQKDEEERLKKQRREMLKKWDEECITYDEFLKSKKTILNLKKNESTKNI